MMNRADFFFPSRSICFLYQVIASNSRCILSMFEYTFSLLPFAVSVLTVFTVDLKFRCCEHKHSEPEYTLYCDLNRPITGRSTIHNIIKPENKLGSLWPWPWHCWHLWFSSHNGDYTQSLSNTSSAITSYNNCSKYETIISFHIMQGIIFLRDVCVWSCRPNHKHVHAAFV